jgi:hypothetical protein
LIVIRLKKNTLLPENEAALFIAPARSGSSVLLDGSSAAECFLSARCEVPLARPESIFGEFGEHAQSK